MKKKNRRKLILLIVAVVIVAVILVLNTRRSKVKPIEVKTGTVKRERIIQTVNASGYLKPVTQVKISANVSARIEDITVKLGNIVHKGDLLVELDRKQYEAAYERASSVVQSNRANLRKVQNELKRLKDLYANDLASEAELEARQAETEIAESQVVQSEAALKQALDDLEKTKIVSPIDGTVTSINKEAGEIALGSVFQEDVILVISDMSKMEVKAEVDETDVVTVSIGDTALIEIDAIRDTTFKGIVSEIAHSATTKGAGTQEQVTNFEIEVSVIGQDARFRPGMSSTVDVITRVKDSALVVPIQALTVRPPLPEDSTDNTPSENPQDSKIQAIRANKNRAEDVIFGVQRPQTTEQKQGLFTKADYPKSLQRAVTVGISSDTHFEITTGLEEGEEIVVGSYKAISKELQHQSPLKITNNTKEKGTLK